MTSPEVTGSETRLPVPQGPPVYDGLHPVIWRAIIALALWLVVSVWVFFGASGYTDVNAAVVTGLFIVAIAIPTLLWLTWRRHAGDAADTAVPSFHDWRAGDFDTWTGRHRGARAAIEALLPIAAVAFGMTAFGLVYHLA